MGRPIAKILLLLILTFSICICANAQDSLSTPKRDTNKVILVVTPGQKYTKKPVRTSEGSDTAASKPIRTGYQDYLHPNTPKPTTRPNIGGGTDDVSVPAPAATTPLVTGGSSTPSRTTKTTDYNSAPTTAERPGYQDYLHPNTPKPATRANMGAGTGNTATSSGTTTTTDYNTAPTTAERPGYQDYLHPNTPKPATRANVSSATGNVSTPVVTGGSSTSSSTTTTTTTTTTTLPNGQKKISVKKNDTVYITKTDTIYKDAKKDTIRSMQAIYAEVGGPGLAISLNYDARFSGDRKGLGYRVGAGYFSDTYGNTVFSVPLQVNYLLTKDENNFIELGAGTTFLNTTGNNKGKTFIFDKVTGFAGTATIGYRYQPADHKLNFRIGFVPIFYDEGIIWAGGISIGYNLK